MLCKFVCCDSSPGCTGLGTIGGGVSICFKWEATKVEYCI